MPPGPESLARHVELIFSFLFLLRVGQRSRCGVLVCFVVFFFKFSILIEETFSGDFLAGLCLRKEASGRACKAESPF